MSGVQKDQISKLARAGARTVTTPITVGTAVQVLPGPAAGFVRVLLLGYVLNLDTTNTPTVTWTDGGTHLYRLETSPLLFGQITTIYPLLLNSGEALYVTLDLAPVTGDPVAVISYQDFPASSGLGGGKLIINVATSLTIVPAPTVGTRMLGLGSSGLLSVHPELTPLVLVNNDASPYVITVKVAGQPVVVRDLVASNETSFNLIQVLDVGEAMVSTVDVLPTTPISGSIFWQDSI